MSLQTFRRLCIHLIQKPLVRHTSAFRYHMILREVFVLVVFVLCTQLWSHMSHDVYRISRKCLTPFQTRLTHRAPVCSSDSHIYMFNNLNGNDSTFCTVLSKNYAYRAVIYKTRNTS